MSPRTRRVLRLLALLATLVVGCNAGCERDATSNVPRTATEEVVYVETVPVSVADVEVAVEAVGTIRAIRRVEVRSETEATVDAVLVRDGQPVAAGARLVQLDTAKLAAEVRLREAALAAARVRADNARKALARARDLVQRGFIPPQEFDDSQAAADESAAAVAEAEAFLALARELREDADLRAPIAGIAGECAVDPGDYLAKGDLVLTIIDANPVEVEFSVPEEHLAKLTLGRPVSIRVPSYPEEGFTGTLSYIEPEIQPETRALRLKATITNDDLRLRPGQFATVRAVLAVHEGASLVPEEAIVPEGAVTWVYVVVDGHAVRREVRLGVRRDGRVEVTDGLDGTETVVVNGQLRLREGAPVHTEAAAEG